MTSCGYQTGSYYFRLKFDYSCNRQLNFSNNVETDNIFTTIVSTILDSTSIFYLSEKSTINFTTSITQLSSSTNIFLDKNSIFTTILSSSINNFVEINSILASTNIFNKEDNDFVCYINKDIYIGKISKSKEELEENIDGLIKNNW